MNQRNATGEDFGAGAARAKQGLGNEITRFGSVMNERQEQREISKMNADMAAFNAQMSIDLERELREADPNDDQFGERFTTKVQEGLAKIGESASMPGAKQFFDKASANMTGQFRENATVGQIRLAGQAAKENYLSSVDSLSMAANTQPSNWAFLVQQADIAAAAMPNLSTADRLAVTNDARKKITEAAVMGSIAADPYQAKQDIVGGTYDEILDGQMKDAFTKRADAAIEAREADARLKVNEEKKRLEELNNAAAMKHGANIRLGKGSYEAIINDTEINSDSTQRALFDELDDYNSSLEGGRTKKDDPATYSAFSERLFLEPTDPTKLTLGEVEGAFGRGLLSRESLKFFREEIVGKKDPERVEQMKQVKDFFDGHKSAITRSNPFSATADPLGDARYYQFQTEVNKRVATGLAQGRPIAEVLAEAQALVPTYAPSKEQSRKALTMWTKGDLEYLNWAVPAPTSQPAPENVVPPTAEPTAAPAPRAAAPASGEVDMAQYAAPASFPGVGTAQQRTPWNETNLSKEDYGRRRDAGESHESIVASNPETPESRRKRLKEILAQ